MNYDADKLARLREATGVDWDLIPATLPIPCPDCDADAGQPCHAVGMSWLPLKTPHRSRIRALEAA